MKSPFLQIKNLTTTFGNIAALSDISFELNPGELLVVLGPTGAGKTTLLRTLAGLESPLSGQVLQGDQDMTHAPPADRDIALVFQNFSLYPNMTVRQNLAFPLKAPMRKLTRDEITQQIETVAKTLKIDHLLDRPAPHLSGGEMQRVAIGRAIVRRPKLFLMDEPLTNLDAKLRESLRVEIIRLQRDLNTPMIYVTHDQTEALSMADRIIVLDEGHILQTGSPETIYNQPKTPKIARQLGYPPINLITVIKAENYWQNSAGKNLILAPNNAPQKATLGIRPEAIELTGGTLPATVEIVEDLGPATLLLADWAGEQIHILSSDDPPPKVGATIYPKIDLERVNIWPQQ